MTQEILKYCFENGLLVDKDVLNLFSDADDFSSIKLIIERLTQSVHKKIITKNLFIENKEKVAELFSTLPSENQRNLEKLKIKLGLSIEISKEVQKEKINFAPEKEIVSSVKISTPVFSNNNRLLEVKSFTTYFRNRFLQMRDVLQNHPQLPQLTSINKISGNRQNFSIIGMIYEKKITKNKNLLLSVEDLTGRISILINKDKEELCALAEDLPLDSIIGLKGSGTREIIFANEIVLPDTYLSTRKNSPHDENVLFIGDIHYGSKLFLEESFSKLIEYINGEDPDAKKIKYVFIVGDIVAGIGNYPNQENDLIIHSLEEQFCKIAEVLKKIRSDVQIIISPGNHDGVRIMEPQPIFDDKFAWALHDMKNVTLTGNPSSINIGAKKSFSGFDVLTYHGYSFFYYAGNINSLIKNKAAHKPEIIMKYLLKHRHLAPTHSSTQYYPFEDDALFIKQVPDILVTGHLHKSSVSYYNNILLVSISTWESLTDYMEKVGSKPDFCKVPMFNLKTRAVKILDFE